MICGQFPFDFLRQTSHHRVVLDNDDGIEAGTMRDHVVDGLKGARFVPCVDSVIAAWNRDFAADSRSVKFRVVVVQCYILFYFVFCFMLLMHFILLPFSIFSN